MHHIHRQAEPLRDLWSESWMSRREHGTQGGRVSQRQGLKLVDVGTPLLHDGTPRIDLIAFMPATLRGEKGASFGEISMANFHMDWVSIRRSRRTSCLKRY